MAALSQTEKARKAMVKKGAIQDYRWVVLFHWPANDEGDYFAVKKRSTFAQLPDCVRADRKLTTAERLKVRVHIHDADDFYEFRARIFARVEIGEF